MKYVLAMIVALFTSTGLVWAGSFMASCSVWSMSWLCRTAERVGDAMLAPGIMAELYSGSKLLLLVSDTLFYALIVFLILCFWLQRRRRIAEKALPFER